MNKIKTGNIPNILIKGDLMINSNIFRANISATGLNIFFILSLIISHPIDAADEGLNNGARVSNESSQGRESFQAALYTGAATYSIPIVVPPGTKGLAPNLALQYSSDQGNGWIGQGWELSGLGSIERSTKKGIPKYDANDAYVLNMNGATQELIVDQSGKYHTKIESYLRFEKNAGDYWLVTNTSGMQYRFGYVTGNSRVAAIRTGGGTRAWMLDQIKDTNGNYIEINYAQDTINGDVYPSQIVYSKGNGIACNIPPTNCRTVTFTTESRPTVDIPSSYRSGSKIEMDRRLQQIDVAMNGSLIRRYTLNYKPAITQAPSLLESVTESGTDGTPLPATRFIYEPDVLQVLKAQDTQNNGIYKTIGSIFESTGTPSGKIIADFDADGRADIIMQKPDTNDWHLFRSKGGFTVETDIPGTWSYQTDFKSSNYFGTFLYDRITILGDINSDGYIDVLWPALGNTSQYRLNQGGVLGPLQNINIPIQRTTFSDNLTINYVDIATTVFADMNSDGQEDMVVYATKTQNGFSSSSIIYYPNRFLEDGSFGEPIAFGAPGSWGSASRSLTLGDINGDGLPDIIRRAKLCPDDGQLRENVACNRNFISKLAYQVNTGGDLSSSTYLDTISTLRISDLSNDGLSDIINIAEHRINYYANASGVFTSPTYFGVIEGGRKIKKETLADLNGDGLPEIVWFFGDNENQFRYAKSPMDRGPTNLLTQINTPTGSVIGIKYIRKLPEKVAPNSTVLAVPFPRWVVAQVTINNGLGLISQSNYTYSGGFYTGWPNNEFRGYRSVIVTDPLDQNGLRHKTQYLFLQDDALKGRIGEIDTLNSADDVLSRTINEYSATEDSAIAGFYRVNQTATSTTIYDGAATKYNRTDYTNFDSYGQPWSITITGTGIGIQTSTTQYLSNTSAYIVNRPSHTWTLVDGIKTREAWFAYDQQTLPWSSVNQNAVPTKGNLTHENHWLSGGVNTVTLNIYDNTFGNLIGTIDANNNICGTTGYTTNIEFDSVYRTYPIKTINALCQEVTSTYWGLTNPLPGISTITGSSAVPGLPATQTDLNGVRTESYWDGLGRPVATVVPPDSSTTPTSRTSYANFSGTSPSITPSSVTVKTRDDSVAGAPTLDSYTYFDGLGRTIQTKKEDTASNQFITVDTIYDERGLARKTSIPYTSNSSGYTTSSAPAYTITLSDAMKRPIKTTNTDDTSSSVAYAGAEITATNEKGVSIKRTFDALNRLTRVEEPMPEGGTTIYSYDTYDANGINSQTVRDTNGNVTTTRFDTLGRKISTSDPDMGNWSYEYFPGGQLKTQIDPKGRHIDHTYDALNRVKTKTIEETTVDLTPPVGTVDAVRTHTNINGIDLKLSCLDAETVCTRMQIATDGTADTESWVNYYPTEVKGVPNGDGVKVIAARFQDAQGNISQQVTDTIVLDTIVPTITGVTITNITSSGATFNWTTNEATDSQVEYGTTTSYGSSTSVRDSSVRVTSHSLKIKSLFPSITYQFRVKSSDAAGNMATSTNYSFTTSTPNLPLTAGKIVTGVNHTCAMTANGGVKCWGSNSMGQLASAYEGAAFTPISIDDLTNIIDLAAGDFHACAVLSGGTIKCWGSNGGALGDGTVNRAYTPVDVKDISTAIAVTAGQIHTCALLQDRTVRCWGVNTYGQLGDGATDTALEPVEVIGLSDVTAISAGDSHTCALQSNSRIKCWGNNAYGQLGLGYASASEPTPVEISSITNATAISAGFSHTCALLVDKSMKCWGRNAFGQLGNNSTNSSPNPNPVTVLDISNIIAISAGGNHSCAVLQTGAAYCWGLNTDRQLGTSSSNNASRPAPVFNLTNAVSIEAGNYHTCAVLNDASVKCWGDNGNGQLGNGTLTDAATPVLVAVDDNTPPTISGLTSGNLTESAASVAWSTNEAAGSLVLYGTTANYETSSVPVTSLSTAHAAALSGLAPSTQYHYQAMSWDAAGNLALSPDLTLTTAAVVDVEQPSGTVVITNGATATNSTSVGLTLACSDNVSCTQMQIAPDGNADTEAWTAYAATASTTLSSEEGEKLIAVKYRDSVDNVSNQVIASIIFDTTPPTGNLSINNGGDSTNNRNVTVNLDCIDTGGGCASMQIATDGNADAESWIPYATSSSATISSGDNTKTIAVKFRDAAGNTMPTQVTATITLDTVAPVISNITSGYITGSNATIMWTTNDVADTQVEYGTTTSYGQSSSLDPALVTSHVTTLTGLLPSTTYNYRVLSRDAAGNLATSTNRTFATTTGALSSCAPLVFTATLTPQQTLISLQHFNDLRTDVNTARARTGWPPFNWTDPAPAQYLSVLSQHMVDLRVNLVTALDQIGIVPSFTDAYSTLEDIPIKAQHLNEIRQQVQAVCNF